MAIFDPWGPQDAPETNALGPIQDNWNQFLNDPRGQAALLSVGLSLMQPPSFGDAFGSHLARSVGAGGESARAMEAQDVKRQDVETKGLLREAQANKAEMSAANTGLRSDLAVANLDFKNRDLERKEAQVLTLAKLRGANMYQNYVKSTLNENARRAADLLSPTKLPPLPILPPVEWARGNPMIRSLGLVPEDLDVSTPTAGAGEDTGGGGGAPQYPTAVRGDTNRKPGNYSLPGGPKYWDGTAWFPVR